MPPLLNLEVQNNDSVRQASKASTLASECFLTPRSEVSVSVDGISENKGPWEPQVDHHPSISIANGHRATEPSVNHHSALTNIANTETTQTTDSGDQKEANLNASADDAVTPSVVAENVKYSLEAQEAGAPFTRIMTCEGSEVIYGDNNEQKTILKQVAVFDRIVALNINERAGKDAEDEDIWTAAATEAAREAALLSNSVTSSTTSASTATSSTTSSSFWGRNTTPKKTASAAEKKKNLHGTPLSPSAKKVKSVEKLFEKLKEEDHINEFNEDEWRIFFDCYGGTRNALLRFLVATEYNVENGCKMIMETFRYRKAMRPHVMMDPRFLDPGREFKMVQFPPKETPNESQIYLLSSKNNTIQESAAAAHSAGLTNNVKDNMDRISNASLSTSATAGRVQQYPHNNNNSMHAFIKNSRKFSHSNLITGHLREYKDIVQVNGKERISIVKEIRPFWTAVFFGLTNDGSPVQYHRMALLDDAKLLSYPEDELRMFYLWWMEQCLDLQRSGLEMVKKRRMEELYGSSSNRSLYSLGSTGTDGTIGTSVSAGTDGTTGTIGTSSAASSAAATSSSATSPHTSSTSGPAMSENMTKNLQQLYTSEHLLEDVFIPMPKSIEIFDLKGVSTWRLMQSLPGMRAFSRALDVGTKHYPENLRKSFILNAPTVINALTNVVLAVLSKRTQGKIEITNGENREGLKEFIDEELLEEMFASVDTYRNGNIESGKSDEKGSNGSNANGGGSSSRGSRKSNGSGFVSQ